MNKKRILSIIMALCLIAGSVLGTQIGVSAKNQKGIKITFNGKSVTLGNSQEPKTLKAVEKKLGKKTRLAKGDEEWAGYAYVWEKGKSNLIIMQPSIAMPDQEDYLGYACLDVNDKNISVAGVKVGMKRATAYKKLKATYGKKIVKQQKKGKIYTGITVDAELGTPIEYEIKNDKVSSISWMRS